MTVEDHLLACLIEECAEVQHRACKALRFGLEDSDPTIAGAPTERAMIKQELTDLMAIIELLFEQEILTPGFDPVSIAQKKLKVHKFAEYARDRGRLR